MDVTSTVQENGLITKCLGSKQDTGDRKHEFSSVNVQTEAVNTSSTKENSPIMESLSSTINSLEQKHERVCEDVQQDTNSSQPKENGLKITNSVLEQTAAVEFSFTVRSSVVEQAVLDKNEGSVMEEGAQIAAIDVTIPTLENNPSIKSSGLQQNTLEDKQESDFQVVQSEATNIAFPTSENSLTIMAKENVTGDIQCDTNSSQTKENGLVITNPSLQQSILDQKSESDVGAEQTAATDFTSPTQENSILQYSSVKQSILDQKQESTIEDVKDASDVALPTHGNSPKISGHEQNIPEQKQESGYEVVQTEASLVEQKIESDCVDGQTESCASKFAGQSTVGSELMETPDLSKNSEVSAPNKPMASQNPKKKKQAVRAAVSTPRVLRSRLPDTSKAPDPVSISINNNTEVTKTRKKRKRTNKALDNVFEKTKKRVRYMLNKTNYEHSLIEAYSGDGWKGLSAEKVRPEKELQRATAEILRCKLKIREMFQHIESLCDEGKFQESLFDSEGLIDSEDIFCAKCGSKELSTNNDIILCDGFCTRGFHQKCLDPPLLNEEIPPGDEGWLCPACDCKVDCIDLLNDNLGTDLSIEDSWEKVFPEAAVTTAGNKLEDYLGLPSDDSEDDDYDPDSPELDQQKDEEGSSSDESDSTSASDDAEDLPQKDPYLGLPSDDSDDDDYNPDALDVEKQVNKDDESSSSDSDSDSGDSAASSDDGNGCLGEDEVRMPSSVDGHNPLRASVNQGPKKTKGKEGTINSELRSILEQGDASPISGKRNRQQFDYKKLHDETFGNVSSDSSDDEDWMDADEGGEGKKKGGGKESVLSTKENSRTTRSGSNSKTTKNSSKKKENSQDRTGQKLDFGDAKNIASVSLKEGKKPDLSKKRASASRRRGKAVAQEAHVSSDSRENEDLVADGVVNKKDGHGNDSVVSPNENHKTPGSGENTKNTSILKRKSDSKEKRSAKKLNFGGSNSTASDSVNQGLEPDTIEKRASAATKLGKAVVQRLFESIKENEYPTRDTKENLAEELGLTVRQVDKWFGNTRWSLRHPSGSKDKASPSKIKHVQTNGNSQTEQNDCPNSDATMNVMPEEKPGSAVIGKAGKRGKASPSKNKLAQPNGKTGKSKQNNCVNSDATTDVMPEEEPGSAVDGKAGKREASSSKNKLAQTGGKSGRGKQKNAMPEEEPGSAVGGEVGKREASSSNNKLAQTGGRSGRGKQKNVLGTDAVSNVKQETSAINGKAGKRGKASPSKNKVGQINGKAAEAKEKKIPGGENLGSPVNNKAVATESSPQKSTNSKLRNKRRKSDIEDKTTTEVQTPVKPSNPSGSSKSHTPARRSTRQSTKQEVTSTQIATRSRRSLG